MTKQDLIGAAITLTLMPCIVGVWIATIVADHVRNKR